MKFVSFIVDRLGTRPAPSKVGTIVATKLSRPTTVGNVRVLLGISGYLRKFVSYYSMVVALISDLLRGARFRSKRARQIKMSWLEEASPEERENLWR